MMTNQPGIVVVDKQRKTATLIDVPNNSNIRKK